MGQYGGQKVFSRLSFSLSHLLLLSHAFIYNSSALAIHVSPCSCRHRSCFRSLGYAYLDGHRSTRSRSLLHHLRLSIVYLIFYLLALGTLLAML